MGALKWGTWFVRDDWQSIWDSTAWTKVPTSVVRGWVCTRGMKQMLGGKGCSGRVASIHSIQSIHKSEIMSEIIQVATICNIPRTCSGGPSSRL